MNYSFTYHNSNGVRRQMHVDASRPDEVTVETTVQLDDILKSIDRDRESQVAGSMNKTLARVPMTIYEKSMLEDWDDADWKRWLNDPANEPFRIWKGRV